jgi:hypothetical protein
MVDDVELNACATRKDIDVSVIISCDYGLSLLCELGVLWQSNTGRGYDTRLQESTVVEVVNVVAVLNIVNDKSLVVYCHATSGLLSISMSSETDLSLTLAHDIPGSQ